MRWILLSATIFLSSCSVASNPVKLPLPVLPDLPKIQIDELQCLSLDVYERLTIRDIMWENHADELESIILSTH